MAFMDRQTNYMLPNVQSAFSVTLCGTASIKPLDHKSASYFLSAPSLQNKLIAGVGKRALLRFAAGLLLLQATHKAVDCGGPATHSLFFRETF